jgi:lipid-A-disaccharide synthase
MKLAIVAGEASGDLHAAEVVRELKVLDPAFEAFGIGGDLLAGEGVRLLHHAREMGIVGLFNVIRHLRMFRRIYSDLIEEIARERPDAVVLVDYPEFNLRVAERCRAMGIRVIYYISPQVWAWRPGRVKKIAKIVDLMIVIFPFEEDFYRAHGVRVVYAGHPLIDELAGVARGNHDPGTPLKVALLPGSRRSEVSVLFPPMLAAVANLRQELALDACVIQATTISSAELLIMMQAAGVYVRIVPHGGGEELAAADIALSSSGTATLECAVIGTPVIVMYRLSAATHWFAQRLVKLRHFSLVNIVAGKKVVPELLQHEVNGDRIASEVRALARPEEHARIRAELVSVRTKLGERGASRRAAEAIMSMVHR